MPFSRVAHLLRHPILDLSVRGERGPSLLPSSTNRVYTSYPLVTGRTSFWHDAEGAMENYKRVLLDRVGRDGFFFLFLSFPFLTLLQNLLADI